MTAVPDQTLTPASAAAQPVTDGRFQVRLINFEGPFDLLLQLIGKHKLDVTEVALHTVTDDFIAHIRSMGDDWDLDEASEFLVIAATLLDLKAARLLPTAEVENEEDLELLSARDLLFARLLQYRAFKQAAAYLGELADSGQRRWPRSVALEPRFADALPDLVLGVGPERLAKIALRVFTPKPPPALVSIAHIHQVRVSVPEHAERIRERLRKHGRATFLALTVDCESTLEVVARFLALLELFRAGQVTFDQADALGELTVIWTGNEEPPPPDFEIDNYGDDDADTAELDADDDSDPDDKADLDDEPDPAAETAEADGPHPAVESIEQDAESAGDERR